MIKETSDYNISNLRDAKKLLQQLENQLEYWQWEKKLLLENAEGVTATNYDKERVSGGVIIDSNVSIDRVIDVIEPKIKLLKSKIKNLMEYIEKELKIIGEYDPIEEKIIRLRTENNMKWIDISEAVNYSERQCQRIFDKYCDRKNKDVVKMSSFK